LVEKLRGPVGKRHAWRDVIQSLELTEALEKSLRRGRVVRLNLEGRSESAAFKGTMASIGCALLVAALLLFVASAVVLKFAEASGLTWLVAVVGKVPYVLAGVFCVFLLVQLLRYLIPAKQEADDDH
jgi:myo-inositol 2-dehydrogenase/D-chiro-inositol 1-dehydrogenase